MKSCEWCSKLFTDTRFSPCCCAGCLNSYRKDLVDEQRNNERKSRLREQGILKE